MNYLSHFLFGVRMIVVKKIPWPLLSTEKAGSIWCNSPDPANAFDASSAGSNSGGSGIEFSSLGAFWASNSSFSKNIATSTQKRLSELGITCLFNRNVAENGKVVP